MKAGDNLLRHVVAPEAVDPFRPRHLQAFSADKRPPRAVMSSGRASGARRPVQHLGPAAARSRPVCITRQAAVVKSAARSTAQPGVPPAPAARSAPGKIRQAIRRGGGAYQRAARLRGIGIALRREPDHLPTAAPSRRQSRGQTAGGATPAPVLQHTHTTVSEHRAVSQGAMAHSVWSGFPPHDKGTRSQRGAAIAIGSVYTGPGT